MRFLWFMFLSIHLYAHQNSLALLKMDVQESTIQGTYKLAVKDANLLVNLDNNFDTKIVWGEIVAQEKALKQMIQSKITIMENHHQCTMQTGELQLDFTPTNKYIHMPFMFDCKNPIESLDISYALLFDKDANHEAYLSVTHNNITHNTLFSYENLKKKIELKDTSLFLTFLEFVREGMIHIFIGIDHILFLVALLLPSVLLRKNKLWSANDSLKSIFINVLKVVTAFTIAHSITLSLSIFGFVSLPSWMAESLIALSVVLAAINNISRMIQNKLWILVFLFGLIHGFGFASVLSELNLYSSSKLTVLFGFNLGVELGQALIVCALVPLLYFIRKHHFYIPFILKFGSLMIVFIGLIWFFERLWEGLQF